MRKLASIQVIKDIKPHPNADRLEIATVLGWQCVVKKGEFCPQDKCVYFEIDSLIPMKHEWARFLQDKNKPSAPARLRTIKLRGKQSQGLCIPVKTVFPDYPSIMFANGTAGMILEEGSDVTEDLEVKKYEPVIPACLDGEVLGPRPPYTIKTDEDRVQAFPDLIEEFKGKEVAVTQKIDGTSGTFSFNASGSMLIIFPCPSETTISASPSSFMPSIAAFTSAAISALAFSNSLWSRLVWLLSTIPEIPSMSTDIKTFILVSPRPPSLWLRIGKLH